MLPAKHVTASQKSANNPQPLQASAFCLPSQLEIQVLASLDGFAVIRQRIFCCAIAMVSRK